MISNSYIEEVVQLWGKEFLSDCMDEASRIAMARPSTCPDVGYASPELVMTVAIGKIVERLKCHKCGLVDNLHCMTITKNEVPCGAV